MALQKRNDVLYIFLFFVFIDRISAGVDASLVEGEEQRKRPSQLRLVQKAALKRDSN